MNQRSKRIRRYLTFATGTLSALAAFGIALVALAFIGPSTSPPTGDGLLIASSTGALGIGTETIYATGTKLIILPSGPLGIATTTPSSLYTLDVYGNVHVSGAGHTFSGRGVGLTNLLPSNLSGGVFATANYAFPASLGIATSSTVLPPGLSVYGPAYVSGDVTIGAAAAYRIGTSIGATKSCVAGETLGAVTALGGLVTGGTCVPLGGTLSGGGALNQVAFFTGATTLASDGELYWNNATRRLGIGAAAPGYRLDVSGDVNVGATDVYRRGGTAGATVSCPAGEALAPVTVSGGIVTGGTCAAVGGGGGGTVTSLSQSTGITLTPNLITATGSMAIDTAVVPRKGVAETVTGGWTFNAAATTFGTTVNFPGAGTWTAGGQLGVGGAPSYPLTITQGSDALVGLVRAGALFPTVFRLGTDSALVVQNGGADLLTLKGGAVGIGTTVPGAGAKLEIAGQVKITGGGPGAGKVLTSDISGLAAWQTPADGTVMSVGSGTGLTGGPITTTGTLSVNTAIIQSRVTGTCASGSYVRIVNQDGTVTCGADADTNSGGTVTSLSPGTGITLAPNPITTTGTISNSGVISVSCTTITCSGTNPASFSIGAGAIANSQLVSSAITVATGVGLSGGGVVPLGDSLTLANTGDLTPDTIADDGVITDGEASDSLSIMNGLLYAPALGTAVGIGNTNPNAGLHIQMATPWTNIQWNRNLILGGTGSGTSAALQLGYGGSTRWGLVNSGADFYVFSATTDGGAGSGAPSIRLAIAGSSGNVGIGGVTIPGAKLDVLGNSATMGDNGFANLRDSSNRGVSIGYDSSADRSWIYSRQVGVASKPLGINDVLFVGAVGGNVGIGNPTPGTKFDVTGAVHATGDICTDGGGGRCLANAVMGGSGIGGSGTVNYVPRFVTTTSIGNSQIVDTGMRVGINIVSPQARLHVEGGSVLFGSYFDGTVPASGAGGRFMWVSSRDALRAGRTVSNYWDYANVGDNSIALGYSTMASGFSSVALGHRAEATGSNSVAIGYYPRATGQQSIAIGVGTPKTSQREVTQTNAIGLVGGNVGIDTGNPTAKLEVVSESTSDDNVFRLRRWTATMAPGSVELFPAVGNSTSRDGQALCQTISISSYCIQQWTSGGTRLACQGVSAFTTYGRALCADFGD